MVTVCVGCRRAIVNLPSVNNSNDGSTGLVRVSVTNNAIDGAADALAVIGARLNKLAGLTTDCVSTVADY